MKLLAAFSRQGELIIARDEGNKGFRYKLAAAVVCLPS